MIVSCPGITGKKRPRPISPAPDEPKAKKVRTIEQRHRLRKDLEFLQRNHEPEYEMISDSDEDLDQQGLDTSPEENITYIIETDEGSINTQEESM